MQQLINTDKQALKTFPNKVLGSRDFVISNKAYLLYFSE